jgi:hypothetical protein
MLLALTGMWLAGKAAVGQRAPVPPPAPVPRVTAPVAGA